MPVSRAYLYCEISAEQNIPTENFGHNVVGTEGACEKLKTGKSGCNAEDVTLLTPPNSLLNK